MMEKVSVMLDIDMRRREMIIQATTAGVNPQTGVLIRNRMQYIEG